jgi:dihydrofolate synthase/folylpolyglutamate synthase
MMNSKAVEEFLKPLAPLAQSLHSVAIPGEANSLSAEAAAGEARAAGFEARPVHDVTEALARIAAGADEPGRVLICGSLYLAGRVLADNG